MDPEFKIGETVWDDLTRQEATIIGISTHEGTCKGSSYLGKAVGYWLDNDWVGGGRFPWEIRSLDKEGNT